MFVSARVLVYSEKVHPVRARDMISGTDRTEPAAARRGVMGGRSSQVGGGGRMTNGDFFPQTIKNEANEKICVRKKRTRTRTSPHVAYARSSGKRN